MEQLKLAVLDMYDGEPNQGMRALREILKDFENELSITIFDVRAKGEMPDISFDIYISSGGPGNPLEGDGEWDTNWNHLMDQLWRSNLSGLDSKKHVFFICHSFQMICAHFGIGEITKRRKKSFGTFPCHKTKAGKGDTILKNLEDPFWVADFREYQVVQPNLDVIEAIQAKILAVEKPRAHVPYERALMCVRFSDEFFGTQFHPEADPRGMREHFMQTERREAVFEEFGKRKYYQMLEDLDDPSKIAVTHNLILPLFLSKAIKSLRSTSALAG